MILLADQPPAIALTQTTRTMKSAGLDLLIVMKRTQAGHPSRCRQGLWLEIEVPDSPRGIERITALLHHHQKYIAGLISRIHTPPMLALLIRIKAFGADPQIAPLFEIALTQLCTEFNAQGTIRLYGLHDND